MFSFPVSSVSSVGAMNGSGREVSVVNIGLARWGVCGSASLLWAPLLACSSVWHSGGGVLALAC